MWATLEVAVSPAAVPGVGVAAGRLEAVGAAGLEAGDVLQVLDVVLVEGGVVVCRGAARGAAFALALIMYCHDGRCAAERTRCRAQV